MTKKLLSSQKNVVFRGFKKTYRIDAVWWVFLNIIILLFTIIAAARITVIGQVLDEVIFDFLFGWFKYVFYINLLIFSILGLFKIRILLNKKVKILLWCFMIVTCSLLSEIFLIQSYLKPNSDLPLISGSMFPQVMNHFIQSWYHDSIFSPNIINNLSFWKFNGNWIFIQTGGGIIGEFCVAVTSYLTVFGPLLFIVISYFLIFSWIITGRPLGLFIHWKRWRGINILYLDRHNQLRRRKNWSFSQDADQTAAIQTHDSEVVPPALIATRLRARKTTLNLLDRIRESEAAEVQAAKRAVDHAVNQQEPLTNQTSDVNQANPNFNIADLNQAYLNSQGLDPATINKIPQQKKDDPSQYIIPEGFKRRQQQPQVNAEEIAAARSKIINNSKVTPFGPRPLQSEPTRDQTVAAPPIVTAKGWVEPKKIQPQPRPAASAAATPYQFAESELSPYGRKQKQSHPEQSPSSAEIKALKPIHAVPVVKAESLQHVDPSLQKPVTPTSSIQDDVLTAKEKYQRQQAKIFNQSLTSKSKHQNLNQDSGIPPEDKLTGNEMIKIHKEKFSFLQKIKKLARATKDEVIPQDTAYADAHYLLPPLTLLKEYVHEESTFKLNQELALINQHKIEDSLSIFKVQAIVERFIIGPSVTKYEVRLEPGEKVRSILNLRTDLELALGTNALRIEHPIIGKPLIGLEIPNHHKAIVGLKKLLRAAPVPDEDSRLIVAVGRQVDGEFVFIKLNKTPHLLIAGSTGSGKTVCINAVLISLLLRTKPHEVKLLLIDPKKVELNMYDQLPHLLAPVITKPQEANEALSRLIAVMHERYDLFNQNHVRNIEEYNNRIPQQDRLPWIVVIIDELADLMMTLGKLIEEKIQNLTQLARAAGIHLVIATQRPSTDIITGVIKTNIPSRIAFAVANAIDSRTILDSAGAEKLLGKGDMLVATVDNNNLRRVQGAFVEYEEIADVVKYIKQHHLPNYDERFANLSTATNQNPVASGDVDPLYNDILQFIITGQKASTSLLQRKFSIGYNRASRIIDQLEAEGVIGPQDGVKPRVVYWKE